MLLHFECLMCFALVLQLKCVAILITKKNPINSDISFVMSKRGKTQLCVDGFLYMRVKASDELQYWSCNQFRVLG